MRPSKLLGVRGVLGGDKVTVCSGVAGCAEGAVSSLLVGAKVTIVSCWLRSCILSTVRPGFPVFGVVESGDGCSWSSSGGETREGFSVSGISLWLTAGSCLACVGGS
jgi:hypothetical protein